MSLETDAKSHSAHPRAQIEKLIREHNLKRLLENAAQMHGHYCPGLASGVKAAHAGISRLGLFGDEGMEDVIAEVECNSCFVDAIQFVTGCSLGNNALMYHDLGKTAVSLYRRSEPRGLRVAVKNLEPGIGLSERERDDAQTLFQKSIKKREKLTEREGERFRELWTKSGFALLEQPDEDILKIESVDVDPPSYAPIHDSAICSICGERVMETRARLRRGQPVCLSCCDEKHYLVGGSGIHISDL